MHTVIDILLVSSSYQLRDSYMKTLTRTEGEYWLSMNVNVDIFWVKECVGKATVY